MFGFNDTKRQVKNSYAISHPMRFIKSLGHTLADDMLQKLEVAYVKPCIANSLQYLHTINNSAKGARIELPKLAVCILSWLE